MSYLKKIQLFRNIGTIYSSFTNLENSVLYHKYNNVLKNDRGSYFVYNENLLDGEPIVLRYYENGIMNTAYAIAYRNSNYDTNLNDFNGTYRHLSVYKDYKNFININKKYANLSLVDSDFITNIKYDSNILTCEKFLLKNGENIIFNKNNNVLKIGCKPDNTIRYENGNGVILDGNTFSLKMSNGREYGGVFGNSLTKDENFTACPIIDGIPYYKKFVGIGAGNDTHTKNIIVNGGSGWYRIIASDNTINNIINYGIFNIAAYSIKSNVLNSSTISFSAGFAPGESINYDKTGVYLTQIHFSNNSPNIANGVIKGIRVVISKNYNLNKKSYIDLYLNYPSNTSCYIDIDSSNTRNFNIFTDNISMVEGLLFDYVAFQTLNLKPNSIISDNIYQGLNNNETIDETMFATSTNGGIIKLGLNPYTNGIVSYLKLDENKRGYVNIPATQQYNLPEATETNLGGVKTSDEQIVYGNFVNFPLNVINDLGFMATKIANTNDYGVYKLGGNKENITIPSVSNLGTYYPIQLDKNEKLCVRVPLDEVPKSTMDTFGGIKIRIDKKNDLNTPNVSSTGNYYPIQLDNIGDACVRVPITSGEYTLPVAGDGILGGIKLYENKVNFPFILNEENDGDVFPVVLDNNNKALVSIIQPDIESVAISDDIFTCNIDNFEMFEILVRSGIMQNGYHIKNFKKFFIFQNYYRIEIQYFIREMLPYINDDSLEMNIYLRNVTDEEMSNIPDIHRSGVVSYYNDGFDSICNLNHGVDENGNIDLNRYYITFNANRFLAHIHIVRIFPNDGSNYGRPTFSIMVDLI